jgi:hypothetical protein
MVTLIKAFIKTPEEDWSGITRGKRLSKTDELAPFANAHIQVVSALSATYSSGPYSNTEWRVSYGFSTMEQLVNFVEEYTVTPEAKQWKTKIDERYENNSYPTYKKSIIILDDEGNQVQNHEVFANTEILKNI